MQQFLQGKLRFGKPLPQPDRIPGTIRPRELWRITALQAKGKGYTLDAGCEAPLKAYYARRQQADAAKAGNGRMARNVLEKAILNQGKRLIADPAADLALLLPDDFELEEDA